MPTSNEPVRDDDEIDLFHLAGVLWRGRWVIALFVIVAVALGGYYAYRVAVPLYPARSRWPCWVSNNR